MLVESRVILFHRTCNEVRPPATNMTNFKDKLIDKYRHKIREKAIVQAKKRIALSGKKVADFSPDELEFIVVDEEQKIKAGLRNTGIVALLIALGLS